MKRVLCLSGGGVRGIAQLEVLKMLEEQYGKPLYEVYDLIIGTSVGAINASIISTGKISMTELSAKYESIIKQVFQKRGFFKKPKYDRRNFEVEWNKLLGRGIKFGEAKTKLMITTVDYVRDINIFYKSWHEDDSEQNMLDLVERSFAAPLYFGQIVDPINKMVYGDGGVGNANLPLDEAKLQAESFGWYNGKEEVEIHAIGTLYDGYRPSFEVVANGSWWDQVMDYLNPQEGGFARAQSREDQIRRMKYICKHNSSIKFKYWDASIHSKRLKLDGVEYMDYYRHIGKQMSKTPLISFN